MPRYILDAYKSRDKRPWDRVLCEVCERKTSVDVHHTESSFRASRKHYPDGSDLIFVCRDCHDEIHAKNNFKTREGLKEKIKNILNKVARNGKSKDKMTSNGKASRSRIQEAIPEGVNF